MGTKKLINTSSSPPISYLRHCDNFQQHTTGNKSNSNTNNTCCSVGTTNKMFTKLRNYFQHIKTSASSTHRRQHNHRHHEKLTNCNSITAAATTATTHNNTTNSSSNTTSNSRSYKITSPSNMFNIINIIMLVLLTLINTAKSNPVFVDNPSLAQFQSGRNIRHLPCIVRKSGRSGVCMFAIDCIKQNGTHLGTCIDRFYFGSCCDIKEETYPEIADNSIDQNTISHHFTPEASTMPTSALFKLTTLSPTTHHYGNISSNSNTVTQQDVTQMLNSVTQTFASTTLGESSRPTTLVTNSNSQKPSKATTTAKPSTHKHSQFVIRTTSKPHKPAGGSKPSHYNTTTKKKTTPSTTATSTKSTTTTTTTTTTTVKPFLTTTELKQQQDELQMEVTTPPTKLFTYQIVETTQYTPTEPTKIMDFVTTERVAVVKTTKKPHTTTTSTTTTTTTEAPRTTEVPRTTEAPRTTTTITTTPKETTTTSTTTTPKPTTTTPKPTTTKSKPQTTRKPTTTKKPTTHKRTTVKPTRKPVTTTTVTDFKTEANVTSSSHTTDSITHKPTYGSTILQSNKTTHAPRPKPKPTASIVKVPKPIITSTTTTTTTTTTTQKPTTAAPETTTEATKSEQTTTTTTTTKKPTTTAAPTTTTKPPIYTTTKVTYKPIITSTHKPGLVTWTNIDGEPVVEPNKPIASDWIPVTTEEALETNNNEEEESSSETTGDKTTYEESNVSVSSSVSAMMNNHTIIIAPPKKPVLIHKPATTSTSSSTSTATKEPTKPQTTTTSTTMKPSAKPTTTTTQKPITTSTLTNTEQPEISSSSTITHQFTTEGIPPSSSSSSPSGSTSEEFTTESFSVNSTTSSPVSNGLEGVDYRQVCGRRMFPEPRIVGGSNAAFGRWPWQISLRQWRTSTYLHKCGAALLNENWAITAAHCVDNVPPSDLLLRLGEYDLAEEEEPYGYQERRVQIVASHPQFDPRTFEYDLALLRFYEPVVFQPNIIPVCVPEDDENFIGQTAFVTGWGRLYEDGPLPSVLQEVAVPVINNTICESMYRSAGYIEHIPHIFICAGWKKGGYDSCEGDSGGPMVLQRESDKRFQLGGVISWGIGCAEANQPGVYTRISEFRDWINQILQF